MKNLRTHRRGFTLLETLISASLASVIFGVVVGVYSRSTSGFYREAAQTYVQNRVRTELTDVAKDVRTAKSVLPKAVVGSKSYYASNGQSTTYGTCLILLVPSQDTNGLFYFGSADAGGTAYPAPGTLVNDLVVYYYGTDSRLFRTVVPNVYVSPSYYVTSYSSVKTTDGTLRSSYRPPHTLTVTSRDMSQFKLRFRDKDGKEISSPSVKGASVDVATRVSSGEESNVSMTGIRLRNMRSASIYGLVTPVLANVKVEAIMTGSYGAYPVGTVVGSCLTTTDGAYEVYGLVGGKYKLRFTTPGNVVANSTDTSMAVEDEQPFNAGTQPVAAN